MANKHQDLHLITPRSSLKAIEAALSQNPHLTSLPLPKADVLAPESLTQTSGTAEILRHPDVQSIIKGDFLVLPCDLICEIPGESFLEAWMIQESGLGGVAAPILDYLGPKMALGGERGGRRGGLGAWYETKTETSAKDTETDFVITTPLSHPIVLPPSSFLRPYISKLVYTTTTDTLRDITLEKKNFPVRHSLIQKHGRVRILTTYRDAHIYIFPHWILEMITRNPKLDSISEDIVGWWAKASWQDGLASKLGLPSIFDSASSDDDKDGDSGSQASRAFEEEIDLASMSTTFTSALAQSKPSNPTPSSTSIPPILAYVHPPPPPPPHSPQTITPALLLRVDTPALLLTTSLQLALLEPHTSPLSHPQKISTPSLLSPQTSIHTPTTLLAPNVTVAPRASLKESVIGASCTIGLGAKISRSVLMDEVVVGEKVVMSGCVVGRRVRVGDGAVLKDCEVQGGFVIEAKTEAAGEKFMAFDGLDDESGDDEGMEGES